jgi:hypothetical protein
MRQPWVHQKISLVMFTRKRNLALRARGRPLTYFTVKYIKYNRYIKQICKR